MIRGLALGVAVLLPLAAGCGKGSDSAGGSGSNDSGSSPESSAPPPHDGGQHRDGAGGSPEASGSPDVMTPDANVPTATIHYLGRFDMSSAAGATFAWPGSAIAATFTGTGISATLNDTGSNYFVVVVDGGKPTVFQTTTGMGTYPLASGLTSGTHTVTFTKRTESYVGVVQLLALTPVGGALVPSPAPFTRRIEYVGDSITCGYGDLGTCDPSGTCCTFSASTEDETVAYGALTAATLDAQQTVIAYSGIGMLRNYSGTTTNQMPSLFTRILADDTSSVWSFSTPAPDVVIINLGTNDFATGDPGNAFVTAYEAFITGELRAHYPNAYVLCALSPLLGDPNRSTARTYLNTVVSTLNAAGDKRVSYFEFAQQNFADGLGCDYHPSTTTQAKDSAMLVPAIKTLTGW
jgi:lysophospholipase L1-like esterase